MTQQQQTILSNYFTAVLPFCNMQKVLALLASLGYQVEEASADICMQAYTENGKDFYQPFGRIAQIAISSPKYEAYMKQLKKGNSFITTKLAKASGDNKLTNDQKVELANGILGSITSMFTSGTQLADTLVNKDSRATEAQAQLLLAEAQANQQNSETTKKWLMPVIIGAAVLIITIVLIVVLGKKK